MNEAYVRLIRILSEVTALARPKKGDEPSHVRELEQARRTLAQMYKNVRKGKDFDEYLAQGVKRASAETVGKRAERGARKKMQKRPGETNVSFGWRKTHEEPAWARKGADKKETTRVSAEIKKRLEKERAKRAKRGN